MRNNHKEVLTEKNKNTKKHKDMPSIKVPCTQHGVGLKSADRDCQKNKKYLKSNESMSIEAEIHDKIWCIETL